MMVAGDAIGLRSQQGGGSAYTGVSAPSHQATLSSSLTQKSIDVVELENKKLKLKLEKVWLESPLSLPPSLPLHAFTLAGLGCNGEIAEEFLHPSENPSGSRGS